MFPAVLSPVACTGPGEDSAVPAAYLLEEESAAVPALDTDALSTLLGDAVALAPTLNADAVLDAYTLAMLGSEPGCPAMWTYNGEPYWSDDCFASDGSHFDGYAFHSLYVHMGQADGSILDGSTFSGVVEVTTAEGSVFTGGGDAWHLTTYRADSTTWESGTTGAFAWDGTGSEGTWFATEVVPELTQSVTLLATGEVSVYVDGGYTGADGADVVVFDGLTLDTASACTTEPSAVLSVRDETGGWYDVIFEGADAEDTADCDGCGAAWFSGEALGRVCVDFAPLIDFEESPWG